VSSCIDNRCKSSSYCSDRVSDISSALCCVHVFSDLLYYIYLFIYLCIYTVKIHYLEISNVPVYSRRPADLQVYIFIVFIHLFYKLLLI
jgi:hypothetical protein